MEMESKGTNKYKHSNSNWEVGVQYATLRWNQKQKIPKRWYTRPCRLIGWPEQGNQGDHGNQGNQGDQGDQGDQGYQGDQGDQGGQGNQGDQSDQGDQGDQSDQGNQGDHHIISS